MRVRVLTVNIQNDEGNGRRIDLINAELRRLAGPHWRRGGRTIARVIEAELAFTEPVDGICPSDHVGVVVDLEIANDP
jgi:hypothetical protein